jgi:hypothetical protein
VIGAALRGKVRLALLVVARVRGDRLVMVVRGSGLEKLLAGIGCICRTSFREWFDCDISMANMVMPSSMLDRIGILATEVLLESSLHLNGALSRIRRRV